jgi:hypothetical protein
MRAPNSRLNSLPALMAPQILMLKQRGMPKIERRIAAIEAGTIPLEPWDEVRRRIERDVLGR